MDLEAGSHLHHQYPLAIGPMRCPRNWEAPSGEEETVVDGFWRAAELVSGTCIGPGTRPSTRPRRSASPGSDRNAVLARRPTFEPFR